MILKSTLLARALLDIPAIARDAEDKHVADELLDDINAGRVKCLEIAPAGAVVGSLVYEIRGGTLIIHALRCDNIEADCTAYAEQVVIGLARHARCRRIACDTKRPGLVAKLAVLGWQINSVSLAKIL